MVDPFGIYTSTEVRKILKLKTLSTVQQLIRDKKLKAVLVGNRYRITGQQILDFMGLNLEYSELQKQPLDKGLLVSFTAESKQADFKIKSKAELLGNGWLRVKDVADEWVYYSPGVIVSIH